jgi:hypothetical protein
MGQVAIDKLLLVFFVKSNDTSTGTILPGPRGEGNLADADSGMTFLARDPTNQPVNGIRLPAQSDFSRAFRNVRLGPDLNIE